VIATLRTYECALEQMRRVLDDDRPRVFHRRSWRSGRALRGVRADPPYEYTILLEWRNHHTPGPPDTWLRGGELSRGDLLGLDWETTA
jgi:hypothetical protein